jgi:hypothetical protein
MTPELNSKIALWRHQLASGTLTEAEEIALMREAILAIRETRYGAACASEKSRAKKAPVTINPDDLLGELSGL